MKVLSIDVGIKNLAYCLIDTIEVDTDASSSSFKIIQWDVLNLCGNDEHKCGIKSIIKKNGVERLCDKKATHICKTTTPTSYICSTHLKKLHPDIVSIKTVKKAKNIVLLEIANKYSISIDPSLTKKQTIELIVKYIEENLYHEMTALSANHMDLISIGISIRDLFNLYLPIGDIDKIIIENQISPIANRMKSIQGMIAQYFIMNNKTDIHFISSANKLKYFLEGGQKTEYGERKKLSVDITKAILSQKEDYSTNLSLFNNHKKKDDLADSFLQGLWFLVHNSYIAKVITYTPEMNI
jgi:hypothetical protein